MIFYNIKSFKLRDELKIHDMEFRFKVIPVANSFSSGIKSIFLFCTLFCFLFVCSSRAKAQFPLPYANFTVITENPENIGVCDEYTVVIGIETTGHLTNAELHLEFQTNQIEIISMAQPLGSPFDLIVLAPEFNNSMGTISFAAGVSNGISISGTYSFISIVARALDDNGTAEIEHILTGPTPSRIVALVEVEEVFYGVDVLNSAENILINLGQDVTNPVVAAPNDIVIYANPGECEATNVSLGMATATDNCGILIITNDNPIIFPIGTTIVGWFATDFSGNLGSANQQITVLDGEAPSIVCNTSGSRIANQPGFTYLVVDDEFDPISIYDNCTESNEIIVLHNASAISGVIAGPGSNDYSLNNWHFPLGTTTVWFYAEDESSNIDSCSVDIIVILQDNYADFVITSVNPLSMATCDTFVVSVAVQTSGPITNAELQMEFVPSLLEIVSASQSVSSPFDLMAFPPAYNNSIGTVSFAAGIIGGISIPGTYAFLEITIKALGDAGIAELNHVLSGMFTSRINTVILQDEIYQSIDVLNSAEDLIVTLSPDIIAPEITAPVDLIIYTDPGVCQATNVNLGEAIASDNCTIPDITNDAPLNFPLGITVVTWYATDNALNTASAVQNVLVLDGEAPVFECASGGARLVNQLNSMYQVDGNEFDPILVSDNCSSFEEITLVHNASEISGVIAGLDADEFSLNNWQFPVGSTLVLFFAEDLFGNIDTCEVEIVVNTQVITIITNINANCAPLPARIKIYEEGSSVLVATYYSDLDINSEVIVDASQLDPGNYDVYLKIERFLQKGFLSIDVSTSPTISASNFKAGDISGVPDNFNDNVINSLDLSLLLGSYNTVPSDLNYNQRCDLNCNVVVDALDLSLLLSNYFTVGEQP
jgi:hypothetical protein